ncbi:DMT family transporter [Roseivivax sp. CAU 1753]
MQNDRETALATAVVIATGSLWGIYWVPVRQLEGAGLPGAWGTFAIALAAALVLLPGAIRRRRALSAADPVALAFLVLGGAAFALYSIGLVYGRVAIIILLFFLTPVWSTLIARYVLGWYTPRLRIAAIALGVLGLGVMLSAHGEWPVPRNPGEWMALASGIGWSVATTGIRTRSVVAPAQSAFVFALGAALAALAMAALPPPRPVGAATAAEVADVRWIAALGTALLTGAVWWAASMVGLMWATMRLEPARVGILLMAEVLIGSLSAAIFAQEHLNLAELAGGGLVLLAGILELWPVERSERQG